MDGRDRKPRRTLGRLVKDTSVEGTSVITTRADTISTKLEKPVTLPMAEGLVDGKEKDLRTLSGSRREGSLRRMRLASLLSKARKRQAEDSELARKFVARGKEIEQTCSDISFLCRCIHSLYIPFYEALERFNEILPPGTSTMKL